MQSIPLRRAGKWLLRLIVRELLEEFLGERTPTPAPVSPDRTVPLGQGRGRR
jgi:hypothetical protein